MVKMYARIRATANSRIVKSVRIINVITAVGGQIDVRTSVTPPIRCVSRWPAVMLAVNQTTRAMGWINKLIVSMIISMGISGIGVPWGRKWANDASVLWRKPVITAPAHNGIAISKFIDSWMVGVKEWGNSRFVDPINIISETSIKDQVCPFELCIIIICLNTSWISHCWNEISWLLISQLGEGNRMLGNKIIKIMMGSPIIV